MPTRKSAPERSAPTPLALLTTGVPGLDAVLGGGLPALSFNLVAGGPGSGKTTLSMQLLFATSTPKSPGLFITLLGETSLKMLRYQQRFHFFDMKRVGKDVHFLNLSEEALRGDLDAVLARIVDEVGRLHPGFIVVDSFRSLIRAVGAGVGDGHLEQFVQRLALHLTTWEVTSLLIGEYEEQELRNPVFTVADGIIWLTQAVDRNSVVRKLQVVKSRGVAHMPGLHTMRMTDAGVHVFPRIPMHRLPDRPTHVERISTGIPGLDALMRGGVPAGDSLVLAGPTGSGKSTFAMQFVAAGLRVGESVVIAIFEERPEVYLARAKSVGVDLRDAIKDGRLAIIYMRPLDLSVDETLEEIRSEVDRIGAKRVVLDSISGFEMALAPTFREDFRESLYRLIGTMTSMGVTMFSTVEVALGAGLQLTGHQVSFLTDDIISQRFVEIDGELEKALVIVKMRGSDHNRAYWRYDITEAGVTLREPLREFDGISSGIPSRSVRKAEVLSAGLTSAEAAVLDALAQLGGGTRADVGPTRNPGVPEGTEVDAALARLEALGFLHREGDRYTPILRARGP